MDARCFHCHASSYSLHSAQCQPNLPPLSTPASFTAATISTQLRKLPAGCVDLIYIDPPFNSNPNYEVFWGETKVKRSFEDRHESSKAYIDQIRPRCVELRRVLKKTGSFLLPLRPATSRGFEVR